MTPPAPPAQIFGDARPAPEHQRSDPLRDQIELPLCGLGLKKSPNDVPLVTRDAVSRYSQALAALARTVGSSSEIWRRPTTKRLYQHAVCECSLPIPFHDC